MYLRYALGQQMIDQITAGSTLTTMPLEDFFGYAPDPLEAVVNELLGHLHGAWSHFTSMLPDDVELWSFEGWWPL